MLRLDFEGPANLKVRECVLEYSDVELYLERAYFLNFLLGVVKGTLSDSLLRNRVCSMLLDTGIDLREKYLMYKNFEIFFLLSLQISTILMFLTDFSDIYLITFLHIPPILGLFG